MNARATLRALAVASVVAAGCRDATEPPLPAFSVSPATQWSGGTITIRSSYFINRAQAPIIVAGTDTLALTPVDDSTARTSLPRGPSGPVVVELARGTQRDPLGTVQRVGYSGKRTVTPALQGELLATDSAGIPIVFGGAFTGTANREPIVRLKVIPGASQVLTLRQPSNMQYGIAPSVTPGAFTVRDSTDSLRLASLLIDAPSIIDPMPWAGTGFTRQVSLLSPHLWLMTGAHQSFARWDTATTSPTLINTESVWAVFMSPRGDRTTVATYVAQLPDNGVPVWDNATGEVAYRLPLRFTETAVFTPDGATLFVGGGQDFDSDTLVAVDASSGSIVAPKTALPGGFQAFAVTFRPAAGGQLLVAAANSTTMALLVYNAFTLELLGVLPTSGDCGPLPATGSCFQGVVTMNDAQSKAYIVVPGDPTPIWTFDLWPGP